MNQGFRLKTAGVIVVVFCSCTHVGVLPASAQQPSASDNTEQTFLARCSTCHAEHGEGSEVGASLNVPDLRSPRVQQLDDATLRHIIQEGRGDMPKFRRDFSDEEINLLIKLVRSFARRSEQAKMQEPPVQQSREK